MTYNFLRKYFSDGEFETIKAEKEQYKNDFTEVANQYMELLSRNQELSELKEQEFYWNNHHTKKDIFYLGRFLPVKNDLIQCDLKNFITPNDASIQQLIKDNNLQIVNNLKCNEQVMSIYRFCRKDSIYFFDYTLFGKNEVWQFPFEFLYLNKNGDCDDNSHYIASMLIGAGIPAFRVRVVCGMCDYGGHSTVYVLSDDFKKWHHINSTGGMEANDNLTDCPTTDSSLDKLGIKDVWFSFNNEYSWSDFENKTTAATLDKELNKLIKIV